VDGKAYRIERYRPRIEGLFARIDENGQETVKVRFAPVESVPVKPNLALTGDAQFLDFADDGQPALVVTDHGHALNDQSYEEDTPCQRKLRGR
jgi:hypothetical protein